MFQNFKVITLSCAASGGDKWGNALRGAGFGGASKHFIQTFKNEFYSRNLAQNMPIQRIY